MFACMCTYQKNTDMFDAFFDALFNFSMQFFFVHSLLFSLFQCNLLGYWTLHLLCWVFIVFSHFYLKAAGAYVDSLSCISAHYAGLLYSISMSLVLSVFCLLLFVLDHMHDVFVLILWTDDSQTLGTLHDSPCHYEYLYQCVFLKALCISTKFAWNTLGQHAQCFVYVATVDFLSNFI